jgi:hypothetical protein
MTDKRKEIEQAIDNMDALCERGRAQVKALLRALSLLPEEEKVGRWRPEVGDGYYTIDAGLVCCFPYDGGPEDRSIYNSGNCFRTEEQAKKYAKYREARQRLELLALGLNGPDYPIVPLRGEGPMYFIKRSYSGLFVTVHPHFPETTSVYFRTKNLAKKAIELTSDGDLITLFGIGKESK